MKKRNHADCVDQIGKDPEEGNALVIKNEDQLTGKAFAKVHRKKETMDANTSRKKEKKQMPTPEET